MNFSFFKCHSYNELYIFMQYTVMQLFILQIQVHISLDIYISRNEVIISMMLANYFRIQTLIRVLRLDIRNTDVSTLFVAYRLCHDISNTKLIVIYQETEC